MALFLPRLKQRGQLDATAMTLCSVGSRKNGAQNDFGSQAWGLFAPRLAIYGFDADADACEAANLDLEVRQVNWTEQHFPYAIAQHPGDVTLYVTQDPQCSSLYPPNEPFLRRFDGIRDLVQLEFTVELEATTLDAALQEQGIQTVDFCQIDVQGANLQVLEGAAQLLSHSVLGIQVEVEFSPLYVNQPLFADVDRFLRDRGFMLFDISAARRTRGVIQSVYRPGQLLWADAYYVRDPFHAATDAFWTQPDQIFKLACIADALDFLDYALELLEYLTLNYGQQPEYNFADAIVASLGSVPQLVERGLETFPVVQSLHPFLTQPLPDLLNSLGIAPALQTYVSPEDAFRSEMYARHTQRRLEHLASLGLPLHQRSVLEVGAGIGEHTSFFLDRGCQVVCTEGRPENLEVLHQRFADVPVRLLDVDDPDPNFEGLFEIVYCYGLLYHLHKPAEAIAFMAAHCEHLLLLETCVSFGEAEALNPCEEPSLSPTQSVSGKGCRPTRKWVFNRLKDHFPYVYLPLTQPSHKEFLIDWTVPPPPNQGYMRAVFIASREPLDNPLLVQDIPTSQRY